MHTSALRCRSNGWACPPPQLVLSVFVTSSWFDGVYLEDEQREVLSWMVQSERSLPHDKHGSFLLADTMGGCFLLHPFSANARRSAKAI